MAALLPVTEVALSSHEFVFLGPPWRRSRSAVAHEEGGADGGRDGERRRGGVEPRARMPAPGTRHVHRPDRRGDRLRLDGPGQLAAVAEPFRRILLQGARHDCLKGWGNRPG